MEEGRKRDGTRTSGVWREVAIGKFLEGRGGEFFEFFELNQKAKRRSFIILYGMIIGFACCKRVSLDLG